MKNAGYFRLMNRKRLAFVGFILLLAACWYFNRQGPELKAQDQIQFKPIGSTGIELSSTIHLYNPNLLSITINRVHEKFLVKGKLMGELDVILSQGIPGLRETEFPVNIRFSRELLDKAMAGDSSSVMHVAIDGEITYEHFVSGGTLKIHIP